MTDKLGAASAIGLSEGAGPAARPTLAPEEGRTDLLDRRYVDPCRGGVTSVEVE